ncbi:MAG: hypothetical protein ACYTFW_07595 [Planctomycetota bacterium]|jgi:hypothetical protein
MMMLRKMGIRMASLLFWLFEIMEEVRKSTADRSDRNLLADFSYSGSHGHTISALQKEQSTVFCGLEPVKAVNFFSMLFVTIADQSRGEG